MFSIIAAVNSNFSNFNFQNVDSIFREHAPMHGTLHMVAICVFILAAVTYRKDRKTQKCRKRAVPFVTYYNIDLIEYFPRLFLSPETGILPALYYVTLKYGNIFKVFFHGLRLTVVNSPDMIQKVLMSNNPQHLNKPKSMYQTVFAGFENGLLSSDVDVWAPHRKILSRSFTYPNLQKYLIQMNMYSREMLSKLSDKVEMNEPLHLSEMLNLTVAKTILYLIMGPHTCTDEEISIFHQAIQTAKDVSAYRMIRPWLLFEPLWRLHPFYRKRTFYITKAEQFGRELLRARREKFNKEILDDNGNYMKPSCMVEEMLERGLPDGEIMDEAATLMGAGAETTSTSMNILWFFLALNPDHQQLCREEVDSIFDAKIQDEYYLTMDDLCSLKHLERCMLETQRIAPSLPIMLRRLDGSLKLDHDLELEAGQWVLISPWTLHKNPEIYPNPEKFDPDRFLPENCKARHSHAFIPFSAGPRNCIGWKLANAQLKVATALMLRNFEIHTTDKLEDVHFTFAITLGKEKDVNLIFKKRVHK